MNLKTLTPDLCVSPQIGVGDMAALKGAGVRAIICNRPDAEEAGQPTFAEIQSAAHAAGIEMRHIPVAGQFDDQAVVAFGTALDELPRPVLAFCRTGTRSATLWALSQAAKGTAVDVIATAQTAGYDLSAHAERIANGGVMQRTKG